MFASHPTSNPATIRLRLIEHAHDSKAWERGLQASLRTSESIFEWRVIRHLTNEGYETIPQYSVGACRIDIVVTSGRNRLAVELLLRGFGWAHLDFRHPGYRSQLDGIARWTLPRVALGGCVFLSRQHRAGLVGRCGGVKEAENSLFWIPVVSGMAR